MAVYAKKGRRVKLSKGGHWISERQYLNKRAQAAGFKNYYALEKYRKTDAYKSKRELYKELRVRYVPLSALDALVRSFGDLDLETLSPDEQGDVIKYYEQQNPEHSHRDIKILLVNMGILQSEEFES